MTTTINSDVSTQDWVKKFHFDNKVDLNLQAAADNESTKIEVDEIPAIMNNNNNTTTMNNSSDSYLQSILSASTSPHSQAAANNSTTACTGSQTCACYKCQRQRRRAGVSRTATPPTVMKSKASPDVYTPLKKIENVDNLSNRSTEAKSLSSSTCLSTTTTTTTTAMTPPAISTTTTNTVLPPTPAASPSPVVSIKAPTPTSPVSPKQQQQQQTQKPKRSSTLRKTPTLKSYEKHMPRPAYAQQDSIYRIEQDELEKKEGSNQKRTTPTTTNDLLEKATQDNYQISWKDEGTGDDLLTSLVTFQTIFEEKAVNENEGLSDLLEQRTKELQSQKHKQHHIIKDEDEELPPRLSDCLTLSYRNGPRHNPLTLYHTMKMNGEKERMIAYNVAFQHCINANSGMRAWIKKTRVAPTRENSKLVQSANAGRKPTIKRSLLHPLASRKNKVAGDELLIYSASSENLSIRSATSKKSIEMISAPMPLIQPQQQQQQDDQITDIISTAHALLPNRRFSTNTTTQQNKIPYEHIDTPSRPRQNTTVTTTLTSTSLSEFRDNSSTSSSESANGGSQTSSKLKKSRPGRLFSSLGRKTSMRSHSSNSNKASSIRSLEKIDSGNESTLSQEKVVLDDLCRILPHIERSQLLPYVQEANCDYMKALQLCKSAVISGKLS